MKKSHFDPFPDIIPEPMPKGLSVSGLIEYMGATSFEARNVKKGASLFSRMIDEDDVIWLGIAGAGIAGGMGGMVISLLERGFIDVICSTGAQVYHDLHFAFGLPVKAIPGNWDDNRLRASGDTRIYDIGIREKETLEEQDRIIRKFIREELSELKEGELASWEFNHKLGEWAGRTAPYPERSFLIKAVKCGVPVFWDSHSNHSIGMNIARMEMEGISVPLSPAKDIFDSAAIAFGSGDTGFIELGGGGPKNFIQQTGPTISQILGVEFEGAERGLQIGTAVEKEGSLSGCTFSEAVTWGKYSRDDSEKLVQIWGEYSVIFPLLCAWVIDRCPPREPKRLAGGMPSLSDRLKHAAGNP